MLEFNRFSLLLIRHAQSEVNALHDRIGQSATSKLTNLGYRQSQLLGVRFDRQFEKFDRVWSSDYTRAIETAKTSLPDYYESGAINLAPDLREYSAGDWIESKRSDVVTPSVKLKMNYMGSGFLPPNGESMHQVERRASQWLEETILYNEEICQEASRRKQQNESDLNIAVYSHGMTIKCLLHYVMGFDQNFIWKLTLENTSITKLTFNEEGWRLITINDHAHLL